MPNITGFSVSHSHSVSRGELPPPAPRDCFGRDELVEKVVGLAENLKPVALIGTGGIGKTSIALTVLHHIRIKARFGENRRFIRCDQFPASGAHLLARLSKVIGAEVKNPEDITSLRPSLSSNEMLIVLDNAESILDPQVTNSREIYSVVEELCQLKTISLLITSRITTVPRHCKRPEIPTLSMEAACDIFYGIYCGDQQSSTINDLLRRLDFHALSIILLATTATHNAWDYDRLAKEWDTERSQVLQADHNESLAATIELSLASPTFHKLGPDARDLLGVIAFFPQGIDERNLDWLFPTIPNRKNLFDRFCVLSLTYRSNGFATMLSPIRDYLGPQDPQSSPLLCATRDLYFRRLSVDVDPDRPGFGEAQWIVSEDVNVEHLLSVFTSVNGDTGNAWGVCRHFIQHLHWYKPRRTVLGSEIEALPDDHHHKPACMFELSELFQRIGNRAEQKRLLTHTLELERRRGDDYLIAHTLRYLSDANRLLDLYEEGIQQTKEASEIYERIGDTIGQTRCLNDLAWLLFDGHQLDAAEDAASRAIDLVPEKSQEVVRCQLHRILGQIYRSKGKKEEAIHHFETAIEIASPFNWHEELCWIYHALAELFLKENEFDDANAHIEQAKSHTVGDLYRLGRIMHLQARVLYRQGRLEDAKSEVFRAVEIFEKLGAAKDAGVCGNLFQEVEQSLRDRATSS
jgi:tetratricopeptide (TPR) repeat protein